MLSKLQILLKPVIFLILTIATLNIKGLGLDSTNTKQTFCGFELEIPENCVFTDSKISQGNQFVQWFNDTYKQDVIRTQLPELFLNKLQEMLINKYGKYKKKAVSIVSCGEELDGYLYYVRNGEDKRYYFFTSGKIQSGFYRIYACTIKNPRKKINIPDFIEQIAYISH